MGDKGLLSQVRVDGVTTTISEVEGSVMLYIEQMFKGRVTKAWFECPDCHSDCKKHATFCWHCGIRLR